MNPSVEEAEDEPKLHTSDLDSGNEQLSWSKISLRHESMLSSHLEMLHSARNAAHGDDNMVQIISSMLEKTNRLVSQFRVVKKQLKNGKKTRSESTTPGDANTASTAKSNFSTGKKRARAENEATNMTTDSAQENFSQKKRLRSILSSNNEDMRNVTPVSIETEDISEEVQRRLEIKEEQRKKRGSSTSAKRKRNRDSLASNDSTSSSFGGASRPKKRRRELGTAKTD